MKRSPKVVVSFTESEWLFVTTNLMTNDVKLLEQVLSFLVLWETRTGSDTPVFIQMTRLAVQALLYDYKHCLDVEDRSNELNAISIYGLSLTRFINFLNEICQPKVGPLISIASAVKEIGIPEEIVLLRQNVVHTEMPSIGELRNAMQFCRDWLWEMHWSYPMEIAICDLTTSITPSTSTTEEKGVDLKPVFAKFWNYKSRRTNNAEERQVIETKTKNIISLIGQIIDEHLQNVLDGFSNELVMSEDKMKSVKLHLCLADFNANKHLWSISEPLFEVWRPIFNIFAQGRYGCLLIHLTGLICDEFLPLDHRYQLVAWVRCILSKISLSGKVLSVVDLNSITCNVMNAYGLLGSGDFEMVISMFGSNEERKTFFKKRWGLKRPSSPLGTADTSYKSGKEKGEVKILTFSDLTSALAKQKATLRQPKTILNWSLEDLKSPLGLTIDQTAETLNLRV